MRRDRLIGWKKTDIKRYDYKSIPAAHTYDNCHTFNWTETELLGRAQTKHAREFKEAWYSIDGNTINRQLKFPLFTYNLKQHVNVLIITIL